MMDDDELPTQPFGRQQQNSVFGAPRTTISNTATTAAPITRNLPFGTSRTIANSHNPAPEGAGTAGAASEDEDDQKRLELEALKAKLAEKKRRLQEKQRKAEEQRGTSPPRTTSSGDEDTTAAPPPASSSRQRELAARNAVRFAPNNSAPTPFSSAPLPEDHRAASRKSAAITGAAAAAATATSSSSQVTATEREDLSSAVALVGTCPFMCPEEELQRRQRESDIQLLEIPNSMIYPSHYTLRDTAVKRFRRSAADYKLDVPEWVRPADVLEKVCGYLEEWVMVRLFRGFLCHDVDV
jgi:hypothetical protein